MRTPNGVGLLAGVLTLIYGASILGIFISMIVGFWRPASTTLNKLVLAALDMVVYIYLGAQMVRDRREFFVSVVFWTIFGIFLATFASSYRNAVLNLLSFLIVFLSTHYYVSVTRTNVAIAKSLGLLAGILAFILGIFVALSLVLPRTQTFLEPPLTVATITAGVYLVSSVGMMRYKKEFFVLAILWTIVESALAIADSSFMHSHFNLISILILAFTTYYYFAKKKT